MQRELYILTENTIENRHTIEQKYRIGIEEQYNRTDYNRTDSNRIH